MSKYDDHLVVEWLCEYIQSIYGSKYEDLEGLCEHNKNITINNIDYTLNHWIEDYVDKKIFVVKVSRKKLIFCEKVYVMGVLINGLERKILIQEEMWDLGY